MWKQSMSGDDPKGIPALNFDFDFHPLMISPNEAQNLETQEYTDQKICGIYRVPLEKISNIKDLKTYSSEHIDISYVKGGLSPILQMMKEEIDY